MYAARGQSVRMHYSLPAAPLRPFVTAFYCADVTCSSRDAWLEDYLQPEWVNLRFLLNTEAQSAIGAGDLQRCSDFSVTGPTSRASRFRLRAGRVWGIGLLPEGWAALLPAQAGDYADRLVDGLADPVFAGFGPLARALAASDGGFAQELELIETHVAELFAHAPPVDPAIAALTAALADPECVAVAELAEQLRMTTRSLERLSRRAFGFTPKLLLRRQRFLRSLARFMLDPSLKWLGALGDRYYDQSHFVRDFRCFVGMSPSAYAKLDKPLLIAAARARMAVAGEAMQALHRPVGSGTL